MKKVYGFNNPQTSYGRGTTVQPIYIDQPRGAIQLHCWGRWGRVRLMVLMIPCLEPCHLITTESHNQKIQYQKVLQHFGMVMIHHCVYVKISSILFFKREVNDQKETWILMIEKPPRSKKKLYYWLKWQPTILWKTQPTGTHNFHGSQPLPAW